MTGRPLFAPAFFAARMRSGDVGADAGMAAEACLLVVIVIVGASGVAGRGLSGSVLRTVVEDTGSWFAGKRPNVGTESYTRRPVTT